MSIKTIDDINFRRIGENLKRIRNAKGETQQEVADAIGMQSYGNYERGTEKISLWRLLQVCEHFHVDIRKVIEGCSPAFCLEWNQDVKSSSEFFHLMECIRDECIKMSNEQLQTMLNMGQAINQGK